MRKLLLLSFFILCTVLFASYGLCSENPAKSTPKERGLYLYGNVVSLDENSMLLRIKSPRGEVTVDVTNAELKGYKDLKSIKPGDRVRVRYTNFGIRIENLKKKT